MIISEEKFSQLLVDKDIIEYEISDYDDIKNIFKSSIEEIGGEVDFFGVVNNLSKGISDIDAIVIATEDKIKKSIIFHERMKEKNEKYRYMFYHDPVFIVNTAFYDSRNLHTFQNSKIKKDNSKILYEIWFIHISNLLFRMLSDILNNKKISGRRILMLQKNFMESHKYFFGEFDSNLVNRIRKEKNYESAIDSMISIFNKIAAIYSGCSGIRNYKCSNWSFFESHYYFVEISKNNVSVNMPTEIYNTFIGDYYDIKYKESAKIVEEIYSNLNLKYPFLKPFPYFLDKNHEQNKQSK